MSKFFYARLAAVNIKKNSKLYLPYILSSIFTVAMFYILLFIAMNKGISQMSGSQYISVIMVLGSIVIGVFSVILLLYTNSILMKRRNRELGLYNVMGMGKNHIARVMAFEVIYVALMAITAGLAAGILLSKLMLGMLLKLLHFRIPFGFEIPPLAIGITVLLFAVIFFLTLLLNLGRIHLSTPIELLYGGNVGEKEPKTKWLLALVGLLSLGSGYVIAITIVNPKSALQLFFLAVLLVIFGTYCLFTAGSVTLLKALRKNKSYYYTARHFTSVSGMIYRMKQNAAGLANICILSTMVLVMLSSTVSLYLGMEDELHNRNSKEFAVTATGADSDTCASLVKKVDDVVRQSGATAKNVSYFRYNDCSMSNAGNKFSLVSTKITGDGKDIIVFFVPLEDYNRLQGTSETMSGNELLVYKPNGTYTEQTAKFNTLEYKVKKSLSTFKIDFNFEGYDTYYFIVPDEQAIKGLYAALAPSEQWTGFSFYDGFDAETNAQGQGLIANHLDTAMKQFLKDSRQSDSVTNAAVTTSQNNGLHINVNSFAGDKDTFLYMYGGLFFLGIFLGVLFVMATVIIMYYKQMSEGYDDKKRFEIMQKVGLCREEIKKAIHSQVLTVFFLPLAVAGIHILAAFNMISKCLSILNLTNVTLFAWCTVGTFVLFAVIYAIVYALTARTYYKIVS